MNNNNTELSLFSDKNVSYTGPSSSNIDVHQGDQLQVVLANIVVALSNLIEKVDSCSFCQGEDNTISLSANNITASGSSNTNTTIVTNKTASIKTTPSSTGVNVDFNLNDVINNLGENTSVLKTKTTIVGQKNGYPSNIITTDKTSATVMLKPDNFPAYIETELRYSDSTGEKTVSLKVPVNNTASEINLPLQGGNTGVTPINTQEDLNANHQDRLLNLENLVTSINNVNITGSNTNLPANSNLGQTLAYVLSEIESIKAALP